MKRILGWILFVGGILFCLVMLGILIQRFGSGVMVWLLVACGAIYLGWHYIRGGK